MTAFHYGPDNPNDTYVPHSHPEHTIGFGEVVMNYAVVGKPVLPALLLIPGQTESANRRFACEANMRPVPVVAMEPSGQRGISLL